ncbi:hypothetical protein HU200_051355 [Digitaria exilis]|uniref:Uncharacterized protein n=1 Tax=Digitaria exilis TaxID=1010633 RepID=A0A835ALD2_9POAL|nr:hypothetical protein HU200_051355 [Digitaria exilis]
MEALSLIDVSAEDDLLFDLATPPPAPAPPRHPDPTHGGSLVGAEAAPHVVPADGSPAAASRTADPDGVTEEQSAPERTESPKQRKVKKGVNLRKSLAWDSAFFTSEGSLSTQGSRLPGIVEEMRKSGDSTSTLDSEVWATESLDTQLFDSVRASIQKSLAKPNKVPGGPAGSSKPPKATANGPCIAGGVVNRPAAAKAANTSASRRLGRVTVEKSVALTSTNSSSCGLDTRDKAKTKSTLSNPIRTAQRVPVRSSSKPDTSRPLPPRSGSKIPTRGHVGRASPTISPHSSVDSMSSVISGASTASTIGKMSHTSESLNTLSPSLRKSNDCPLTPKLRPTTVKEGLSACADSSNASTDVTNQGKASPFEEINASKSKATKAVPVEAVKVGVDPLKVAKLEACLHQADLVVATDTPKENIPTDHQNVQANVDASSLVDLLTQKLSSISLGEATPNLAS